uniref:hypothetical protein n=1 Tax=uncultured Sphaerochaeta sp. TaxID=886478 RepID=UPI002AA6260D
TLFALGSILALYIREQPYLMLDYILRIAYLRNLLQNSDESDSRTRVKTRSSMYHRDETVPPFMFEDRNMRDLIGYLIADKDPTAGNIKLYGLNYKGKQSIDRDRGIDSILKKQQNIFKRVIGCLPLCITSTDRSQNTKNFYSLPYLIGLIYDILRNSDIQLTLQTASQILVYSRRIVQFESNLNFEDLSLFSDIPEEQDNLANVLNNFVKELESWKKGTSNIRVNPLLLGRIMTRYYNAAENQEFEGNLGTRFSAQICLLFNSILVEESRWGNAQEHHCKLNYNNPVTSLNIFFANIKNVAHAGMNSVEFPVLRFFISCPLLRVYLTSEAEGMIGDWYTYHKIDLGISSFLDEVEVHSIEYHSKIDSKLIRGKVEFSAANGDPMRQTIRTLKEAKITKDTIIKTENRIIQDRYSDLFKKRISTLSLNKFKIKLRDNNELW